MNTKTVMPLDEAKKILLFCSSYERMPTLLGGIIHQVELSDFWVLLGKSWASCDNIGSYTDLLSCMFTSKPKPILEMMNEAERLTLQSMPETFLIYRGCYKKNRDGLSWSLSAEVAAKFPTLTRYRQKGTPLLVTAEVKKADVVAFKDCREEQEIITWQPKIKSIREIAVGH